MSEQTRAPGADDVVVGVDGSPASVKAVVYAAEEAARCGGTAHVVHVVPDYVAAAPMYALPISELLATGREVLRETIEQAGSLHHGLTVEQSLLRGAPVAALVSRARGARALVVGSDRRLLAARIFTGNTSTGVTASAQVPVVSVPDTWQPRKSKGAVLVAVKHPLHAAELLGEAFAVAESRSCRLTVLHVWSLSAAYDGLTNDRLEWPDWRERARAELEQLVDEWSSNYPDVEVELQTARGQAAHTLVVASGHVEELVLVRRAHGFPAAVHLGATARAVLREARCPVRVVPPGHVQAVPGLVIEEDGALKR